MAPSSSQTTTTTTSAISLVQLAPQSPLRIGVASIAFALLFRCHDSPVCLPMLSTTNKQFFLLLAGSCVAFLLVVAPIPQNESYHNFADKRGFKCACGNGGFLPPNENNVRGGRMVIPNFMDILSNILLLLGGVAGLVLLGFGENLAGTDWQLHVCLPIFFGGTAVVSFGSSYYHWNPNTTRLVWDRLPMTIAFMAAFSFLLDERVPLLENADNEDSSLGPLVLYPLLLLGVSSVIYWHFSNDLRPYALVQFLPLVLLPVLLVLFPPQYTHQECWIISLILYVLAKISEDKDYEIYRFTGQRLSGHSLKHILAGIAPFVIAYMVAERKEITSD